MKEKIRKIVSPLYNKVWHSPKGKNQGENQEGVRRPSAQPAADGRECAALRLCPRRLLRVRKRLLQNGRRTCKKVNRDRAYQTNGTSNRKNSRP